MSIQASNISLGQPDSPRLDLVATRQTGRMKPKYLEIADDLRGKIETGSLPVTAQVPTKAALMHEYGVALNTVDRAIEALRALGLVETFQGVGTFVRAQAPIAPINDPASSQLFAALEDRLTRLETLAEHNGPGSVAGELADLRAAVGRLEAGLINLYAATGIKYAP